MWKRVLELVVVVGSEEKRSVKRLEDHNFIFFLVHCPDPTLTHFYLNHFAQLPP